MCCEMISVGKHGSKWLRVGQLWSGLTAAKTPASCRQENWQLEHVVFEGGSFPTCWMPQFLSTWI